MSNSSSSDSCDEEEEHKPQVKVYSCLICAQVAVTFDPEGNVIKREPEHCGNEIGGYTVKWSNEQLFNFLCQSLGLRSKKLYSSLQKNPFPFCEQCQTLLQSLAVAFSHLEELKNVLREKLEEAEQIYSTENLYEHHNQAYFKFRKDALNASVKCKSKKDGSDLKRSATISIPKCESSRNMRRSLRPPLSPVGDREQEKAAQLEVDVDSTSLPDDPPTRLLRKRKVTDDERGYNVENACCSNSSTSTISEFETTDDSDYDNFDSESRKRRQASKCKKKKPSSKKSRDDLGEQIEKKGSADVFEAALNRSRIVAIRCSDTVPVRVDSSTQRTLQLKRSTFKEGKRGGFLERDASTGSISYTTGYGNRFATFRTTLIFIQIERDDDARSMGYQCTSCSSKEIFPLLISTKKQELIFRKHYLSSHTNRYKCRICPDSPNYLNRSKLFEHLREAHGIFTMESYHAAINTSKAKEKWWEGRLLWKSECEICGMPTSQSRKPSEYKAHLRTHMNEEEQMEALILQAPGYKQFSSLPATTTNLLPSTTVSQCGACGQFITNGETGMRLHERDSHPELYPMSTFICPICGHSLSSKALLELHIKKKHPDGRLNEGDLQFQCKFPACPEKLSDEQSLKAHVEEMHAKSEPASTGLLCWVCGKVLATSWSLKQHGLVHSGVRAHHCTFCPKTLPLKSTLSLHLAVRHGIGAQIIKCKEAGCGKLFPNRTYFHVHMRRVHGAMVRMRKQRST
ncbi:unnamed protein product [Orchesella dallaii]|uniref:C2H2-type domain-containing protein n=1 Tax=Orchesella dallaii TaxID=48710 RepID=A0ABP1SAP8_9HEXA